MNTVNFNSSSAFIKKKKKKKRKKEKKKNVAVGCQNFLGGSECGARSRGSAQTAVCWAETSWGKRGARQTHVGT